MDFNPTFDSAFLLGNAPKTMGLAIAVDAGATSSAAPGDSYTVNWTFTFGFTGDYDMVKAPFKLVVGLGGTTDRA